MVIYIIYYAIWCIQQIYPKDLKIINVHNMLCILRNFYLLRLKGKKKTIKIIKKKNFK